MKKVILISFSLLILLFFSCKEDQEDPSGNLADLLGTWTLTESIYTECDSISQNGNQSFECTNSDCVQYTFGIDTVQTERDSLIIYYYGISTKVNGQIDGLSGEFSLSGDRLSLCQENEEETSVCEDFEFSIRTDGLSLLKRNESTGCRETLVFTREE